ncbi:hypothetical protein [Paenibacillus elgii]|uniref:hypothetical protein n=1 Tax=Paenibacillus elgii TaxID=189691 RepID=UPI000A983671|nr:hypothetical protein [Paenibacillus elgii]
MTTHTKNVILFPYRSLVGFKRFRLSKGQDWGSAQVLPRSWPLPLRAVPEDKRRAKMV